MLFTDERTQKIFCWRAYLLLRPSTINMSPQNDSVTMIEAPEQKSWLRLRSVIWHRLLNLTFELDVREAGSKTHITAENKCLITVRVD